MISLKTIHKELLSEVTENWQWIGNFGYNTFYRSPFKYLEEAGFIERRRVPVSAVSNDRYGTRYNCRRWRSQVRLKVDREIIPEVGGR